MAHPPRDRELSARTVGAEDAWIIVAPKSDAEIVDCLLAQSPVAIDRVIWTDAGPIKLYSSMNDFWRDLVLAP